MATYPDLPPEKYKTLIFGPEKSPDYVARYFEDPDYITLDRTEAKKYTLRWATAHTALSSLVAFDNLIEMSDFTKGTVVIRPAEHEGSHHVLYGEFEDVATYVADYPDTVSGYSFKSPQYQLTFHKMWPKDFHDIESNEISLHFKRRQRAIATITELALVTTARPGLHTDMSTTLQELSAYMPELNQ